MAAHLCRRSKQGGCAQHTRHRRHSRFTGYQVEGRTSTFGYLTGDSEGQTADGGTTRRPCIAIRDDLTLDHWFEVTVLGHRARLLHCDYGPASFTGRAIDVTGLGDRALGFSPSAFPTGALGVARELRFTNDKEHIMKPTPIETSNPTVLKYLRVTTNLPGAWESNR